MRHRMAKYLVFVVMMGCISSICHAHDASLTYTTIAIDSERVEIKITIPMETLTTLLPQRDWFEKVNDCGPFIDYFNKKFLFANENIPCKVKLIGDRPLKQVRSYTFTFELTSDATFDHISIVYNMIFELMATHENIIDFLIGNQNNELILNKESNKVNLSVNDLRIAWKMRPFSKKTLAKKDSAIIIHKDTSKKLLTSSTIDNNPEDSPKIIKTDTQNTLVSKENPPIISPSSQTFKDNDSWTRFKDFFIIGVKHILTGYDHIMFLFGLLLMITGINNLLKVITAFTIAHSITLAIAVFGIYALPSQLTESMIALSISFVAFENIYIQKLHQNSIHKPGKLLAFFVGEPKKRWRLTFLFGLIHGFGFSAALREIGMPEGTRAISLFSFNLGVEAGQLMLVALVFPLIWFARKQNSYDLIVRIISISIGVAGLALVVQRIFFS